MPPMHVERASSLAENRKIKVILWSAPISFKGFNFVSLFCNYFGTKITFAFPLKANDLEGVVGQLWGRKQTPAAASHGQRDRNH